MTQDMISQMVLDNADAIRQGVGRVCARANLGADVHADIVADATLALLDKRGASFDPARASAAVFCRMVAYQVAVDKLRAMNRGGQFSGAYQGFGNANFDMGHGDKAADAGTFNYAPAQDPHRPKVGADSTEDTGRAVRVTGQALDLLGPNSHANEVADRLWLEDARSAVATVLPELSADESELWELLSSGSFEPATYAAEHGITTATAYVRANRLRAKMRELLAA